MSETGLHVTLVIPGLCGPGSDAAFSKGFPGRFPALERLLSRSRSVRRTVQGLDATLCNHFGLHVPAGRAPPVAVLTSLVDIDGPGVDYRLRADPVHLRADQTALRFFDSRTFSIAQDEADALVAAFNEFYRERGLRLAAPCPQRWYLDVPEAPAITTVSPAVVAGQMIDSGLPKGEDAAEWHALMNEVQMLFFQHPVNAQREKRGEPMINSLWFWGEGHLPGTVPCPGIRVATDHPLAMGLAQFTRSPRQDRPVSLDELGTSAGRVLVVLDDLEAAVHYPDIETWLAALEQLEQHWFAPLLEALGRGRVDSLEIDPCSGKSYRTTRRLQRRFWKRVRPLAAVCRPGP